MPGRSSPSHRRVDLAAGGKDRAHIALASGSEPQDQSSLRTDKALASLTAPALAAETPLDCSTAQKQHLNHCQV